MGVTYDSRCPHWYPQCWFGLRCVEYRTRRHSAILRFILMGIWALWGCVYVCLFRVSVVQDFLVEDKNVVI